MIVLNCTCSVHFIFTGDVDGVVNLQEVLVLYNHKRMSYLSYKKIKKQTNDDEVKEYAGFVGRKCYRSMLLFRN